ncbi:MAG: methionyl-tRNA formyltransferase, partial [Caldimonas sp.]
GLDTGAMLLVERIAIEADDSSATLQTRLAGLGGSLIVRALQALARGSLVAQPQPDDGVTYANKIGKEEAPIDWTLPAAAIERRLRAFDPFPGASAALAGETVKCWRGRVSAGTGVPGEILALRPDALCVACGEAALDLLELQRPGGRRLSAAEFMQRGRLAPGMRFEPAASSSPAAA